MAKVLFFFTSTYPFGTGETFIENEIEYLSEAFDKVVIISNDIVNTQTRQVPENCLVIRFDYELSIINKLLSFIQICNTLFWNELNIIKKKYKIKLSNIILKTLLITLQKKYIFNKKIKNLVSEHTFKNDEVYLYSYWANDMAIVLASIKCNSIIKKRICRAHRWDIYFEENIARYLPLRDYLLKNIDKYASISIDGCKYNKLLLSANYPSIQLSRLGVKSRDKKNFNTNNLTILSVSNLVAVKNLQSLVLALSILKIDFHWIHIGDGNLKQELVMLANQNIPNKFTFVGVLSNQEVMDYISKNNISLFVNVSLSEGIPVSIMEAMSFGIPCVATAVGGTPEIVKIDFNGFLLPFNSTPLEIASAIEKFNSFSIDEKSKMQKNAHSTWENDYNAEKNYRSFVVDSFSF